MFRVRPSWVKFELIRTRLNPSPTPQHTPSTRLKSQGVVKRKGEWFLIQPPQNPFLLFIDTIKGLQLNTDEGRILGLQLD